MIFLGQFECVRDDCAVRGEQSGSPAQMVWFRENWYEELLRQLNEGLVLCQTAAFASRADGESHDQLEGTPSLSPLV